jgi:hypothetical protein
MEVKGDGSDLNLQRRLGRSNGSYVYGENLIDSLFGVSRQRSPKTNLSF